jgi:hypothetical protein
VSDTPRTDVMAYTTSLKHLGSESGVPVFSCSQAVNAEFARTLERENTFLREQLEATTQGREDFRKHVVSIREAVGIALPDEDTIDAVRRLREQLRLAQEQLKWRPIETAPKDGTEVLLLLDYGIHIGSWQSHGDVSYPFVWKDQSGSVLVRGWKDDPEPIGWMPLPPTKVEGST